MSILLRQVSKNPKFHVDVRKYILELESRIRRLSFFQEAKAKAPLSARDSGEFFTRAIQAMEEAFASDINSYSAMRWLYYLRRTPNEVFEGDLASTGVNARVLTEVYASRSTKTETAIYGAEGFIFPVNDGTLRHVARFVAFTAIIYDLQVGFRLASKGFEFVFPDQRTRVPPYGKPASHGLVYRTPAKDASSGLPLRLPNPELESAVRIYDQRHNGRRTFLGAAMSRAGLAHNHIDIGEDSIGGVSHVVWGLQRERRFSPQKLLEGHPQAKIFGSNGQVIVRFGPTDINLSRLFELYRLPSMESVGIDIHASLCLLVLLLGGRFLQRRAFALLRVLEIGYFIKDWDDWRKFGEEHYAEVCAEVSQHLPQFEAPESFEAFSASCRNFQGQVWPLAQGNPVQITNDYVCIDMWAASNGFLAWFQFPRVQGQVANERAAKFEDVVQDLIDRTRWAEPATRTVRQRALVIDGKPLTDIDAIGSRDGVLLIVSCKSIPYTLEYDRGAHNEIRNAASTVDKAVAYWAGIVEKLDARRVGGNYDFSTFKQIVGVVCTPFEVYTSNAKSLSNTMEGLRWACSLDELANFLDGLSRE